MLTLNVITELIRERVVYVPLAIFLSASSILWSYYYILEHTVSITHQGKFSVISTCKAVSVFTFAPYVAVKVNNFEVLTTAVNSGYDTLGDCMNSSVKRIQVLESEKKIQIYTEDNKIKEIGIIYDPR